MKKLLFLLILALSSPLQAQTGDAAVAAAKAPQETYWQNWTFAALTLVIAGTSIYFISVNSGQKVN